MDTIDQDRDGVNQFHHRIRGETNYVVWPIDMVDNIMLGLVVRLDVVFGKGSILQLTQKLLYPGQFLVAEMSLNIQVGNFALASFLLLTGQPYPLSQFLSTGQLLNNSC